MFLRRVVGVGWRRLLLGVAAASVAATMTFPLLILLGTGLTQGEWDALGPPGEFLPGMLILLPYGLAMTLAGGLPIHLALAALRRQGWLAYALGGALGGGGLIFALSWGAWSAWSGQIMAALLGLAAALAFRAVWRPLLSQEGPSPEGPSRAG